MCVKNDVWYFEGQMEANNEAIKDNCEEYARYCNNLHSLAYFIHNEGKTIHNEKIEDEWVVKA